MENNKTVETLNELLQIINDRIEGFKNIDSKMIESYSGLKEEYDHKLVESYNMRTELTALIEEKGGDPNNTTTIAGGIHRAWLDFKNSISSDQDEISLETVLSGENAAIKAFENALKSGNLCSESSKVVQDQLQELRSSYDKFSQLEKNL
ncbi:PA2169 family four-helix-bundle protein [Kaistella sp. G5-32]|uniref:PA2169 family four-helix-bundle protein n=1 Tax=Kaistella gelatinilytica TaxID=2787636 RepID=A0ABS0FCJ8_9FLAO|nr:PA2169 family four-helix-bundle protein [Kaistella gelatinilytica]MBF8457387.1 PA2169 family four-helix-bundle protein [Kaistella gelatinilytica]